MTNPTPTDSKPEGEPTPVDPEDEALRAEGIRALRAEREANKALKAQLTELSAWKEAQEAAAKTDAEKAAEETERLRKEAASAVRYRVALKKGLTATQANRLVGNTEEELSADADEFLKDLRPAEPAPEDDALDGRPRPALTGGSRPSDSATVLDPAALAASIRAKSY